MRPWANGLVHGVQCTLDSTAHIYLYCVCLSTHCTVADGNGTNGVGLGRRIEYGEVVWHSWKGLCMGNAASGRFGFVVLHYLVDEATMQCVESIRRCCAGRDYHIVVVDNDSANGSYERLTERYAVADDMTLLHNARNEGFARGNNVGYRHCKGQLHCDYIVTINNDAVVDDTHFMDRAIEDYQRCHCGVIGPKIISGKTGHDQNPVRSVVDTSVKIAAVRKHIRRNLLLLHLHLLEPLSALKSRVKRPPQPHTAAPKPVVEGAYKLHGSCLIFMPVFVQHFDEPFGPCTFLYLEEDILYMRYAPQIVVRHAEDVSTDSMVRHDERRKQILYLQRHRDSLSTLEWYV